MIWDYLSILNDIELDNIEEIKMKKDGNGI